MAIISWKQKRISIVNLKSLHEKKECKNISDSEMFHTFKKQDIFLSQKFIFLFLKVLDFKKSDISI